MLVPLGHVVLEEQDVPTVEPGEYGLPTVGILPDLGLTDQFLPVREFDDDVTGVVTSDRPA